MSSNSKFNRRGFFIFFLSNDDSPKSPHITILGQISDPLNQGFEELNNEVQRSRITKETIQVDLGGNDSFGLNKDLSVIRVNDQSQKLHQLHSNLVEIVQSSGYDLVFPQYNGENYSPHITLNEDVTEEFLRNTYQTSGITIDSIALNESVFDEDGNFLFSEKVGLLDFN